MSSSIVIASIARTPIAKFCGSFSPFKASELGSVAIKGALDKLGNDDVLIREAYLGNVVSAGMGQAPARQAVLGAGMPESTICTTVNKVCASGMKTVQLSAQTLSSSGGGFAMLAGGMESMSNIPHYMMQSRSGIKLGNGTLVDGCVHDGLWDVYNNQHMGMCAEQCALDYNVSRSEQDDFAMESYRRAQASVDLLAKEITPVEIPNRRGDPTIVDQDEEPIGLAVEKLLKLKPAFDRSEKGSVTAGNASSLNDGACAMVLMTEQDAIDRGIQPVAKILGFGDAEQDPVKFTTTPSLAVPVALENAKMNMTDIDYHEINEAFAVVALANMKIMNLDPSTVNLFGGAVALGHPIGMSGARIIGTLLNVLQHKDASVGCASICNGGGGASAIIIERMQ
uniref:Acetyl-coa c-acetyltransferase n=1 Tax=Haslea ostrearia TaxID=67476 RepID=A0A3G5BBZ1_HASOS|nr:acetyl-coa c-acetyltransferase [Haslea ostrearia]